MEVNEILKIYGTQYKEMTKTILREAEAASLISEDMKVGIKPNLVAPSPACFGATTHPEIVEGIIEYLRENGINDIVIMEGSWVGDSTEDSFEYCGYNTLSANYEVPLIDTQKLKSYPADCKGMELNICDCYKDIDFLINVPVLKGHCQTKITCALKNVKGLIPNREKRRFHTLGLHEPIAHLNTHIKQNLIVIDHICGDPDYEEGGNPLVKNCVMVSRDPVLTDAYVCSLFDYSIEDVPYVKLSYKLGVGDGDLSHLKLRIVNDTDLGINDESMPLSHKVLDVNYAASQIDSCSACYASLIGALDRLKEDGLLDKLDGKISIGQGHRGKGGRYGVGNCTSKFEHTVKGCPPDEDDIYNTYKDIIVNLAK